MAELPNTQPQTKMLFEKLRKKRQRGKINGRRQDEHLWTEPNLRYMHRIVILGIRFRSLCRRLVIRSEESDIGTSLLSTLSFARHQDIVRTLTVQEDSLRCRDIWSIMSTKQLYKR
jgi:hypothetical protein